MTLPATALPTEAPPAFLGVTHSLTGKPWCDQLDAPARNDGGGVTVVQVALAECAGRLIV